MKEKIIAWILILLVYIACLFTLQKTIPPLIFNFDIVFYFIVSIIVLIFMLIMTLLLFAKYEDYKEEKNYLDN